MAQHDYVIDNSTGQNVRQDINNALQAIVTNNSGSSAPSATFPFMLFADSAAGTMKIRNAADNAFIELFQLDGTFTLEDGSASTPALAFRDDLNTGIFSSAADTFNVATGGVERMELGTTTIFNEDGADVDFRIEGDTEANLFYVDAGNDQVGIGTSSPTALFNARTASVALASNGHVYIQSTDSGADIGGQLNFGNNNARRCAIAGRQEGSDAIAGYLQFGTRGPAGTSNDIIERMRIDSSGHLLVNTSSVGGGSYDQLSVAGGIKITDDSNSKLEIGRFNSSSATNSYIKIGSNSDSLRISNAADSVDLFTLTNSGNVGIGTTSPTCGLHIDNPSDGAITQILDTDNSAVKLVFRNSTETGNNMQIGADGSNLVALTGATQRMRLLSDGDIFLGGANTADVTGNSSSAGFVYDSDGGAGNHPFVCCQHASRSGGSASYIKFQAATTVRGTIHESNNGFDVSYGSTSDYRLKENVVTLSNAITRLKTLLPKRFNWIEDETNTLQDGFLAHEVTTAVPQAVTGTKDEVDENNKPVYQQIDQSKLVPLLVAAVQELIGKVEALEAA